MADERPVPPAELRYPDFVGIGAQKAGTTWLDANLRRHPDLWLPPMKELQYFNDVHVPRTRRWTVDQRRRGGAAALRAYQRSVPAADWDYRQIARMADIAAGPISDHWYGRIFALAGEGQVCGEITPDYATLPLDGIAHLLRLAPQVRIILSLRDPLDRIWSHVRMMARNRNITEAAELIAFACSAPIVNDTVNRSDYPAIIGRWRSLVPADRFLVVFMDDIVAAPDHVLRRVCDFLGVGFEAGGFVSAAEPVHAGEDLPIPAAVSEALKPRLDPIYVQMSELYPEIGGAWLARRG